MARLSFLERQSHRTGRRAYFVAADGAGYRRVSEADYRQGQEGCALSCFQTVSTPRFVRSYSEGVR
jgi:hypothetical protein